MPFRIIQNSIARVRADAIVYTTGHLPGAESARCWPGEIAPGCAAVTPAFGPDGKIVIHAAVPRWVDGAQEEQAQLRRLYDTCLNLAVEHGCGSIALPLLSCGQGFPPETALQTAIAAFSDFLLERELQIFLVISKTSRLPLSLDAITSYLEAHSIHFRESRPVPQISRRRLQLSPKETEICATAMPMGAPLEDFLQQKDAGFMETLLEQIRQRGLKNATVYKRANLSRQHFSKLVNNPDGAVTKPVAVALALALELDLPQTQALLSRAGYTLTNSSIFDLIIRYHIENRLYNVVEINMVLYEFDQILLGN